MREWVNFKVQQFNDDTYLNDEVSTIGNQTLKYEITPLHSFLYKGESAKNLEKHICALLKREYAKNLALTVEGNKFIYCNNIADVFAFAKDFVKTFSDVYELADKPNTKNVGSSIKELVKCYDSADKKEFGLLKTSF